MMRRALVASALFAIVAVTAFVQQATPPAGAAGSSGFVAAGDHVTCAVSDEGAATCWGSDGSGRLGDGMQCGFPCRVPFPVVGLDSGVAEIALGAFHGCARTDTGAVLCWGRNLNGQVGDGTTIERDTPQPVQGLQNAIAIELGSYHACAIRVTTGLSCWGRNDHGQRGDGTRVQQIALNDVPGLTGVIGIALGQNQTCALTDDGAVWCWGDNFYGQYGDGTDTDSNDPLLITAFSTGNTDIAAGDHHVCVVTATGGVKCSGRNHVGQLGDGTAEDRWLPVSVVGLAGGVLDVVAGGDQTCALMDDGGVKCWGSNFRGQLGDGTGGAIEDFSSVPVAVAGLAGPAVMIATEGIDFSGHACALIEGGRVQCWGENFRAELGNGMGGNVGDFSRTPVDVVGLKPPSGDVDCGGGATSIDASLVLQFSAGFFEELPCYWNADVSEDGEINSVDASLMLQFVAGLIGSLPP